MILGLFPRRSLHALCYDCRRLLYAGRLKGELVCRCERDSIILQKRFQVRGPILEIVHEGPRNRAFSQGVVAHTLDTRFLACRASW